MNGALHDTGYSGNQPCRVRKRHHTGGCADDIDHVPHAAAGADGVPMRIQRADGNRNSAADSEPLRPLVAESAGDDIRRRVAPAQALANSAKQRVHGAQEFLGREAAKIPVPHPLVPHCADRSGRLRGIVHAAKHRHQQITVLKGGMKATSQRGIGSQPMQHLCETPFRGIGSAAPIDCGQALRARPRRHVGRFAPGAVITPEVAVAEDVELRVDGKHGGTGGIDGERLDFAAAHARRLQSRAEGLFQGPAMGFEPLGGEVRIIDRADHRVRRRCGAERAARIMNDRHPDARSTEINARHDGHWDPPAESRAIGRRPQLT